MCINIFKNIASFFTRLSCQNVFVLEKVKRKVFFLCVDIIYSTVAGLAGGGWYAIDDKRNEPDELWDLNTD